jgi:hypothetical protein
LLDVELQSFAGDVDDVAHAQSPSGGAGMRGAVLVVAVGA